MTFAQYDVSSTGLIEIAVQTFKRIKQYPERTLTAPNDSSHSLDSVHQDLDRKLPEKQTGDHDRKAKGCWFETGDSVLTQRFSL